MANVTGKTRFATFTRKPGKIQALAVTTAVLAGASGGNLTHNGKTFAVSNLADAQVGDYIVETGPNVYALVKQHIFLAQYFA